MIAEIQNKLVCWHQISLDKPTIDYVEMKSRIVQQVDEEALVFLVRMVRVDLGREGAFNHQRALRRPDGNLQRSYGNSRSGQFLHPFHADSQSLVRSRKVKSPELKDCVFEPFLVFDILSTYLLSSFLPSLHLANHHHLSEFARKRKGLQGGFSPLPVRPSSSRMS
jgi:hypothetical protein